MSKRKHFLSLFPALMLMGVFACYLDIQSNEQLSAAKQAKSEWDAVLTAEESIGV